MTGAACLAAAGRCGAGAGYVTVAVPEPSLPVVEAKLTAPVKTALPFDPAEGLGPEALARIVALAERADVVVLGPGLGRARSTAETVALGGAADPVPAASRRRRSVGARLRSAIAFERGRRRSC